ncbi:TonB-dependent receptor [bacterium]|nr:TonB-dependent receptor [bacterium]
MNTRINLLFLFFFFTLTLAQAEVIYVEAEKIKKDYSYSSSSIELYDEYEIAESSKLNLGDFLNHHSSIQVSSNGGLGQNSSIFLRGSDSRHVVIEIDGVRFDDLTSTAGQADLSKLLLNNIKSIEILKGNQSVLYGENAVAGVIKITTKHGAKEQLSFHFGQGSNKLYNTGLKISGKKDSTHYSLSGLFLKTQGISAYKDKSGSTSETDPYFASNFSFNLTQFWNKSFKSRFGGNITNSKNEYDNETSDQLDKFNSSKSSQLYFINSLAHSKLINLQLIYTYHHRDRNLYGNDSQFGKFSFFYDGVLNGLELKNTFHYGESSSLILGLNYTRDKAKALDSYLNTAVYKEKSGVYANNYFKYGHSFIDTGLRFIKVDKLDELVHRFAVGHKIFNFTFKISNSKALKAPSLYQENASFGGNNDLKAEKSQSNELGILYLSKNINSEINIFKTKYSNFIDYDLVNSKYLNSERLEVVGIEFNNHLKFSNYLSFKLNLSKLQTKNLKTKSYLPRRAKNKIFSSINYFVRENLKTHFNVEHVGRRDDTGGVKLPSYTLFGLGASYQLKKHSFYFQLNNIFDKDFEQISNYSSYSRTYNLHYTFNL